MTFLFLFGKKLRENILQKDSRNNLRIYENFFHSCFAQKKGAFFVYFSEKCREARLSLAKILFWRYNDSVDLFRKRERNIKMKKILSTVLMLVMVLSVFVGCQNNSTETEPQPSQGASSPTVSGKPSEKPSEGSGEDDGSTPSSIFTGLKPEAVTKKEHAVLKELPSSATLLGSDTLPAIDNQGGIGSCASQAITHMQFTNAVAQYKKHNEGLGDWSPSTNYADCFSPKYTYQTAGAHTGNVYYILMDHGALTNKDEAFAKDASGGSQSVLNGKPQKQTLQWASIKEGAGETAFQYRVTNFEQTFVTNNALYTVQGKSGVAMTTSEAGRAMILKIKEALASGNVVVTGGYPSAWQITKLPKNSGTLGKRNDSVITYSTDERNGGHQVCLIGYDDDITITINGITMKGAFLLANSWGEGWGTKGCAWVMYDALNSESEHEGFKLPASVAAKGLKRDWTLDQFCFTYWDRDIVEGKPGLYAELEVSSADRNAFTVTLSRTDALGQTQTITPYMFSFMETHDGYDNVSGKFNANGDINGEAVSGFYTVNFERLLTLIPEGSSYKDYTWSVKILSTSEEYPITVKSMKFKNRAGELLVALTVNEELKYESRTYSVDLGIEKSGAFYNGEYTLENVAAGKFLGKDSLMTLKGVDEKNATPVKIILDSEKNVYKIYRQDEKYLLDAVDGLKSGVTPRYNAEDENRAGNQQWKFSYNADGTISVYLTTEKGTNYALGMENGKLTLVKAMELTDAIKWRVHTTASADVSTTVKTESNKVTVSGKIKGSVSAVKLVVVDAEGKVVAEKEASVKSKTFSDTLEVTGNGTFLVKVLNNEGVAVGNSFIFKK